MANMKFVKSLMREGSYTFKYRSVYPTVTYVAHSSIINGNHPNTHGIVGNSFYDRASGKVIDFGTEDINNHLYLI